MSLARAEALLPGSESERSTGLLPSQLLRAAVGHGHEIVAAQPIGDDQIQPASLDLRLGEVAYRVRASFLPGGRDTVRDKLDVLSMHQVDLTGGAVLEKDCVYIVPLLESLALRKRVSALANPKSSIGRLDVFARVITDYGIEFDRIGYYDPRDFWEPVYPHQGPKGPDGVVLDPYDFYILATREAVVVPPDHAAEMVPYDATVGEFRVHYAGFFDPGFGSAEAQGTGSRAVLEVRSHEVPFLIEHGQVVGRMIYEPLIARPEKLYGGEIGSSYQRQGLALSKHFKKVPIG
jgi:deoxycytidine triphosphate deaminase